MCDPEVKQKHLHELLEIFEKKSFEAASCENNSKEYDIIQKCGSLFKLDYSIVELDNPNGQLSTRYPVRIFIPEHERNSFESIDNNTMGGPSNGIQTYVTFANTFEQHHLQQQQQQQQQQQATHSQHPITEQQNTIYEDLYDISKIKELTSMAKYARCRQRFAVPVIMYRGKYICRSATVSVLPEMYGRKVVDCAFDYINGTISAIRPLNDDENNDIPEVTTNSEFSYNEVLKSDVQLLNALNVSTIVDLMVEKRKIKFFLTVSSSEKADSENLYSNFNILSLPYPGCEFFKNFRDNNYMAKDLYYNWTQSFNDAIISIPKIGALTDIDISWRDYKKWDLVLITQNYLKATLKCINEEKSGLLIHCISGWDRTPLFISLVRLSLWADGLIHQSLNPTQMAYLTIAYDWYLFGHQLPNRLKTGEDIMFFCFHFLKYITDDDFSSIEHRKRTKTSSSSGSSVIVIKSDFSEDEPLKEDYMLNFDNDSNESFSNWSNCDMPATDSTPMTTGIIGRSPNPKRSKTSPISVPDTNAVRQRQESTSSNGSWQVVTDTGSIDSLMNGSSYMRRFGQQQDNSDDSVSGASKGSSAASRKDASTNISAARFPSTLRKQRLNAVRAIFIQAYGQTIGLKFKEGSTMNLATFIGTLADQLF